MAVTFEPKPRLRLPSGELPEPKVVHPRSWLPFAIVAWVVTVIVGHGMLYGWLPGLKASSDESGAGGRQLPEMSKTIAVEPSPAKRIGSPTPTPFGSIETPRPDLDKLPDCEQAVRDATKDGEELADSLPTALSRSPFGALLDSRAWSKPCRSGHSTRVHLCVAVRGGQLLGATASTEPNDSSASRCIIRAVSRINFEPETALRKMEVTLDLPSDRGR
jgi:hypothetical protein